jgi:virulence-associated protein VapD
MSYDKINKCRKLFSFDLDTKKLEQYTNSKTKAYNDIKIFLVDKLKFKHNRDSDYITSTISNAKMHEYIYEIINHFPFLPNVAKKMTMSNIEQTSFDCLDTINTILYSDPKLDKKVKELKKLKEKKHNEEFKL